MRFSLMISIALLACVIIGATHVFMTMINILAEKFGFPKFDFWESFLVVTGIWILASFVRFGMEVEKKNANNKEAVASWMISENST